MFALPSAVVRGKPSTLDHRLSPDRTTVRQPRQACACAPGPVGPRRPCASRRCGAGLAAMAQWMGCAS
eukprot:scaffold168166_cov30-Tisochrysis_lutea.AAC.2